MIKGKYLLQLAPDVKREQEPWPHLPAPSPPPDGPHRVAMCSRKDPRRPIVDGGYGNV